MTPPDAKAEDEAKPQRLHLVFGGELKSLESHEFRDPEKLDIVGIFPDYASAERAWRAKAQADGRQRANALFHRPSASSARARPRSSDPDGLSAAWRGV